MLPTIISLSWTSFYISILSLFILTPESLESDQTQESKAHELPSPQINIQKKVLYIYGEVDKEGYRPSDPEYSGTPYHQMRLDDSGRLGMTQFKAAIESLGFIIEQKYDAEIELNATLLNQYDLVILGSNQKNWSSLEISAVNTWVRQGGGLLGYSDSAFGGAWFNPLPAGIANEQGRDSDNQIMEQFGMYLMVDQGGGSSTLQTWTIDHYLNTLNGTPKVLAFEYEGPNPVRIDPNWPQKQSGDIVYQIAPYLNNNASNCGQSKIDDPDLGNDILNCDIDCALAASEIGSGRVLGLFDRNLFWNEGDGTDINQADNQIFTQKLMLWLTKSEDLEPSNPSEWLNLSPSNEKRYESSAVSYDDKLYVIGGFKPRTEELFEKLSSSEYYDPQTNAWTSIAEMPYAVNHTVGVVYKDQLWMPGGFVGNYPGKATDDILIYDFTKDNWTNGPKLPVKMAGHGAVVLGSNLHVFAGVKADRNSPNDVHYVLDLENQSAGWKSLLPLPQTRNHFSTVSLGGYIYVIGGQFNHDSNPQDVNLVHRYNPYKDEWESLNNLPITRSHCEPGTFISQDGKIVLVGGRTENSSSNTLKNVTLYDPDTDTWTEVTELPYKRIGICAKSIGDNLYASNGGTTFAGATDNLIKRSFERPFLPELGVLPNNLEIEVVSGTQKQTRAWVWTRSGKVQYSINIPSTANWLSKLNSTSEADQKGQNLDFNIDARQLLPGEYQATVDLNAPGYNEVSIVLRIRVISSPGEEIPLFKINAGGPEVEIGGEVFESDKYFTGGKVYQNTSINEISGTDADALYLTEHSAVSSTEPFSYNFPVPNGQYKVRLHFAEIYWGASGGGPGGSNKRVFNVLAENQSVDNLTNYDIYAKVGAMQADIQELEVQVNDGELNLDFISIKDQPKVSAIEIIQFVPNVNTQAIWLESECAQVGANWVEGSSPLAANNSYVSIKPNDPAFSYASTPPAQTPENRVRFRFELDQEATYRVFVRHNSPSSSDDSFYISINGSNPEKWNSLHDPAKTGFNWTILLDSEQNLKKGINTIDFYYRENGVFLDKILISPQNDSSIPTGLGGNDPTCGLSVNLAPSVNAGKDQSTFLSSATVNLNASVEDDGLPLGESLELEWSLIAGDINAVVIDDPSQAQTEVRFTQAGMYTLQLSANDGSLISKDEINIEVKSDEVLGDVLWLEAECAQVGSNWDSGESTEASNGGYVEIKGSSAFAYASSPPSPEASNRIRFTFTLPQSGDYSVYARSNTPSASDDSYYVSVNGNTPQKWNSLYEASISGFKWDLLLGNNQNLNQGLNTLDFYYRENGAQLDKIYIAPAILNTVPQGQGASASNCSGNGSEAIWLEAECAQVGSNWDSGESTEASNGGYVEINGSSAFAYASSPPSLEASNRIRFTFTLPQSGDYSVYARSNTPSASDDSYYVSVNGNTPQKWNSLYEASISGFKWDLLLGNNQNLNQGLNTLDFYYRENGAQLDKIYIAPAILNTVPQGQGASASNCSGNSSGAIWLEAECSEVGSNWVKMNNDQASNDTYVSINPDDPAFSYSGNPPASNSSNRIRFSFNLNESGIYQVWTRVNTPSSTDDSFYISINGANPIKWNGLHDPASDDFHWLALLGEDHSLNQGNNTIDFYYRENGAGIDKIYIQTTLKAEEPMNEGELAVNLCLAKSASLRPLIQKPENAMGIDRVYPNPFHQDEINIDWNQVMNTQVWVELLDAQGKSYFQKEFQVSSESLKIPLDMNLPQGLYFMRISGPNFQNEIIPILKQ